MALAIAQDPAPGTTELRCETRCLGQARFQCARAQTPSSIIRVTASDRGGSHSLRPTISLLLVFSHPAIHRRCAAKSALAEILAVDVSWLRSRDSISFNVSLSAPAVAPKPIPVSTLRVLLA